MKKTALLATSATITSVLLGRERKIARAGRIRRSNITPTSEIVPPLETVLSTEAMFTIAATEKNASLTVPGVRRLYEDERQRDQLRGGEEARIPRATPDASLLEYAEAEQGPPDEGCDREDGDRERDDGQNGQQSIELLRGRQERREGEHEKTRERPSDASKWMVPGVLTVHTPLASAQME